MQNDPTALKAYSTAAMAAATAARPPWTCNAPTPLLELGASVVAAAVSLLEVREVRELDSLVVEEPVSEAVEEESVVEDDESSVVLLPLAVALAVPEVAPEEAGREAVPSAPATVKAGAKLKFEGFSSSVMRKVYEPLAVTASAGIVKEAVPAEAGMLAAHISR